MESDTLIMLGVVGIGAYAVSKVFGDSGIAKTTNAIGDVAQSASGLITGTINSAESLFKNPQTASYSAVTGLGNIISSPAKSQISLASGFVEGLIDGSNKLLGTPSTDQIKINYNATHAEPIMTNIGMTSSGALFSSAKPLVANISTAHGAVSQIAGGNTTKSSSGLLGAKVGTTFSSGASVKSSGASGKYKTGF